MRPRVVDTSLLLASVDAHDRRHEASRKKLEAPGPVVVPTEVLVETIGVLTHRVGRREARAFLNVLEQTEGVELGHASDVAAALDLRRKHPRLSLVDAAGVVLARQLGCALDTWDAAQRKVWQALHRDLGTATVRPTV